MARVAALVVRVGDKWQCLGVQSGNEVGKLVDQYKELMLSKMLPSKGKGDLVHVDEIRVLANNTEGGELKRAYRRGSDPL